MYQITITNRVNQSLSALIYDKFADAEKNFTKLLTSLNGAPSEIFKDDYGHSFVIFPGDISAIMLSDLEGEYRAEIEKKMMAARAGKRLQNLQAADPALRLDGAPMLGGRA